MGLVKGLAVASLQIVNYTKRRPCCSLDVMSQFDKCSLGNTTGMAFSEDSFPCREGKALFILSLCSYKKKRYTHTHRGCSLWLSLVNNRRCSSRLFLTHMHTHAHTNRHAALLLSIPSFTASSCKYSKATISKVRFIHFI